MSLDNASEIEQLQTSVSPNLIGDLTSIKARLEKNDSEKADPKAIKYFEKIMVAIDGVSWQKTGDGGKDVYTSTVLNKVDSNNVNYPDGLPIRFVIDDNEKALVVYESDNPDVTNPTGMNLTDARVTLIWGDSKQNEGDPIPTGVKIHIYENPSLENGKSILYGASAGEYTLDAATKQEIA